MKQSWILAGVVALAFNVFYLYKNLGISVVILTIFCIYVMYTYKKAAGTKIEHRFLIISVYMVLLSFNFVLTTVSIKRVLSGAILVVLLLSLSYSEQKFIWPKWLKNGFVYLGGALSNSFKYFRIGREDGHKSHKYLGQVILGIIIAIPLLFVAVILLGSADAIFENVLTDVIDFIEFDTIDRVVWRIIVFIAVAISVYGMSVYLIKLKEPREGEIHEGVVVGEVTKIMPPMVAGTILVLLNIIYILFAYIQIKFQFLAYTSEVVTYNHAQYAREGFFELVILSVFNVIGIMVINKLTRSNIFVKIGLTITVMCTYVMIFSSFYKMYLYELEYGYTQLRLYVYLILIFMTVFMSFVAFGIWNLLKRVMEWSVIFLLCYYLIISFVNIDMMIVKNNIERYEKTGKLDVYYLTTLSEDALPALIHFMDENYDAIEGHGRLAYDDKLYVMRNNQEKRWFFEYNYRHSLALRYVNEAKLK